ncbi:uncharacterized protein F4822DRAFT_406590 [Hypoxylon trugodes]|uniref:uncharacterized protein n=1 Tax=Hypoxylon trugodes TaxID=326681 RepID=UPI00219DCD66|nr:uncharacterized protein F4822DRAFT_406590 [Hypoxylon trugodes]KAI1387469.1 hypothetical protein F4822DRAFT_406590 [Hypoxylon trugodes]
MQNSNRPNDQDSLRIGQKQVADALDEGSPSILQEELPENDGPCDNCDVSIPSGHAWINWDAHTTNGQAQSLKHHRPEDGDGEGSIAKRYKRRLPPPATPSSSSFQTLKITKSSHGSDHIYLSKFEDVTHGQTSGPLYQQGQTTMDQLTPYPTRRPQGPVIQLSRSIEKESMIGSDVNSSPPLMGGQRLVPPIITGASETNNVLQNLNHSDGLADVGYQTTSNGTRIRGDYVVVEDEYPLDEDLMEEDMANALDSTSDNAQETHLPPSSVVHAWDHDSRSAAEYDPTLQYSSPSSSSGNPGDSQSATVVGKSVNDGNLLDEDVDWNAVYAITSVIPKNSSSAAPQDANRRLLGEQPSRTVKSVERGLHSEDAIPLKPFVRSTFPEKVRDRSAVSGLSSNTVLRTCFRIGEMVNQAVRCLTHQQEVVFELFARVTYSNRETLDRKQHFQFVDLFKDQQPYPAGILTNWRVGSQLDGQSLAFLGTEAKPKICRCVCRPKKEVKGVSLVILSIEEIDWMQVSWAKIMVCGE